MLNQSNATNENQKYFFDNENINLIQTGRQKQRNCFLELINRQPYFTTHSVNLGCNTPQLYIDSNIDLIY